MQRPSITEKRVNIFAHPSPEGTIRKLCDINCNHTKIETGEHALPKKQYQTLSP